MLKNIPLENVKILNGLFRERMDVNRNYLMELDTNCLLQNFYLEAGLIIPGLQVVENPSTANLHWGWEAPTCQLRGHFLGHWLSACAVLSATDDDKELKVKAEKVISELYRCQELNGGEWIGSIPEKYFTKMVNNQYIWSPQYVMHKTILGLTDAYEYMNNTQALEILQRLGDWYVKWIERAERVNPWAVFKGENGGMLEMWARLFELTGDEKFMFLANKYKDAGLFEHLENGRDDLTNCHANASIPLSHGSAKMFEITNDERWKNITEAFWKCAVDDRGMYVTGGQNAGEFWVPPFKQGQFLGSDNQEFCTVYNMVRTADYLFRWSGDKKYSDYIEKCLYNGFLAQQNANTGMPTYFLPLSAGSKKKWGSKRHDFWCCHGTMVQAQTIYPRLIYGADDDNKTLYVSQYIPSTCDCKIGDVKVNFAQNIDMKYYNDQAFFDETDTSQMSRWSLKFNVTSDGKITLRFRVPCWAKNTTVSVNGKSVDAVINDGYITLCDHWENAEITVFFQNELTLEPLADFPELVAVCDGPIVLCGLTDKDRGISLIDGEISKTLSLQTQHTYSTFPWKQTTYVTRNQWENFKFVPIYEVCDETYTVYFTKK